MISLIIVSVLDKIFLDVLHSLTVDFHFNDYYNAFFIVF